MKQLLLSQDPVATLRGMVADGSLSKRFPEIADLKLPIPKGYHHKDNLEHSIRVLGHAIDLEPRGADLIIRTAALLHDIGKPDTREFGKPGVVTFRSHEHVGAKMARKILQREGYSQSEIKEITLLIRLHMRAYGFSPESWTEKGVRRLILDAGGQESIDRLIILFKSDLTTKKEHRRKAVLQKIAYLEEALDRVRDKDERAKLRPALTGFDVMELTGLTSGPELGKIMKYLNSDEGISLSHDEAVEYVKNFKG